jgi:CBS domain-containing protein
MPMGELCVRKVVIAPRQASVWEAANLMRHYHVGDIVVTDESDGRRVPVGIVTDRDIVLEVLAQELNPASLSVGDIMTADLITVKEHEGLCQTISRMRAKGVRRAPVVNDEGVLVGIVCVDDIVELLAEELSELAKLISREQKREAEIRP